MQDNYISLVYLLKAKKEFVPGTYITKHGEVLEHEDLLGVLEAKELRRLERWHGGPMWYPEEYKKTVATNRKLYSFLYEEGWYDIAMSLNSIQSVEDRLAIIRSLCEESGIAYYYGEPLVRHCVAIKRNRGKRAARMEKRITEIVRGGGATFVTLTFTDAVLATTSAQTRRTYVARYLKACADIYVANVDYGEKNGREHYHAVVGSRVDPKAWEYGALNVMAVYNASEPRKMANYITKLTKHALKSPVRAIYSREVALSRDERA